MSTPYEADENHDPNASPSEQEDAELYLTFKTWFMTDAAHSNDWREQARKDFAFRAGDQWLPETRSKMEAEGRVPITFNQVLPIIKAVSGIEINTRVHTVYLPRGTEEGAIIANEGLSQVSEWMSDGCQGKYQESHAFQDALTCGMGWTEDRMDYEEDPDGKYVETQLDPLEMYWDCAARQMNISDSRRRWRARKMPLADAKEMFPGVDVADLNCSWAMGVDMKTPKPIEERRLKKDDNLDVRGNDVTILQVQWYERESYHRVADPFSGDIVSLSTEEFEQLRKRVKDIEKETGVAYPIESVEQKRKVFKQAFIGGKVLKKGPCPRPDGFTLQCVTGEMHHTKGMFFGLVSMLRDPQMMANKWLSQATHIVNTTAKGGIMAEADAFVDLREAQANWARPDAITLLKKGAISSNKIMAKPGVGLASTYFQLIQFAVDSIPKVTGINMELMGLRDAQQAGILEAQRKQAAMTILATLFDALSAYRVEIGKTRLYFIQNYLADGRLIRIMGEDGYQAVRLIKDRVVGEYDVIVDEAPTSPNQKERTWLALKEILPSFQGLIPPPLAVKLLKYVPGLPKEIVDEFARVIDEPNPQAEQAQQLEFQGRMVEIDRDAAAAEKDRATAQKSQVDAMLSMAEVTGERLRNAAQQANTIAAFARATRVVAPDAEEYAVAPMEGTLAAVPAPPQPPPGAVAGELPPDPLVADI